MKTIITTSLSLALLAFGSDITSIPDARETLNSVSGVDAPHAKQLLEVVKNRPKEEIQKKMSELVSGGHSNIVAVALYDTSDEVKQEAAKALSGSKSKAIALKILNSMEYLDLAVRGGTEAEGKRKRTKAVFEESLAGITRVSVDKDLTQEAKIAAFKVAIERMEE